MEVHRTSHVAGLLLGKLAQFVSLALLFLMNALSARLDALENGNYRFRVCGVLYNWGNWLRVFNSDESLVFRDKDGLSFPGKQVGLAGCKTRFETSASITFNYSQNVSSISQVIAANFQIR